MDIRHVVTCFLRHPNQRTLLLGQRSKDVHTYPLHYAAVSGSVEDDTPLERARTEIHEETGLADDQICLLGEGQVIRFPDWDIDMLWAVHPYLFECKDPAAVEHDWEHTHFKWIAPEKIDELETVPKLSDAWESARRAAAQGGKPDHESIFRRIRDDRDHGAGQLGIWTLEGITNAFSILNDCSPKSTRTKMADVCRRASQLRPSISTTLTAAAEAWDALSHSDWSRTQTGVQELEKLIGRREQAPFEAAENAARLIRPGSHLVTISVSATVLATLHAAQKNIRLLSVGESRPACEGRKTAQNAASMGIDTELLTDAAAAGRVRDADLVVIGADSIKPGSNVGNKTGSLALCSAARVFDISTLVVSTTHKILPADHTSEMEEMSPDELGEPIKSVDVRNPYFELIPAQLVQTLATEHGADDLSQLKPSAEAFQKLLLQLENS